MALRLGGAVLFTAVAVLAATKQISGWWLAVPLTALCLWSAVFTWRVRRSGLTPIVVLADAAVISALALAQQHMVPAVLIVDDTTWMLPLACTSVYILQIALRPWLGLSGAAIVVIAYGLGSGHPADAWLCAAGARSRRPGCAGYWPRATRCPDRCCTNCMRAPMWPNAAGLPSRSKRPGCCRRSPARPGG
jgi:hypothetical protein